jgi:choline dehydrogenase-like flavoprotein
MPEESLESLSTSENTAPVICIIGSGAAALSIALKFAHTSTTVIILESSSVDVRQPCAGAQLALVRAEMTDRNRSSCHRYQDPAAQALYNGQVSQGVKEYDATFLTRHRVRVYGGTTNCWGGWTRTLDAVDLTRHEFGGPWPFKRDELDPFYREAQWLCSLGPEHAPAFPLSIYDDPSWLVGKTAPPIAAIPFTPQSQVRTGVLSVIDRKDATDHGLDFQLQWGPAVTSAPNVRLIRNANVRRIEFTNGVVTRVVAQALVNGKPGPTLNVTPDVCIVAAGGVETARLLLLSNAPNRSQKLGRGFMVHPLNDWPAPGAVFRPTGTAPSGVTNFLDGGIRLANPPLPFDPSFQAVLTPTADAMTRLNIGNFRAMVSLRGGSVNFNWEQEPDDANFIGLSTTQKDVFGDPVVDLRWDIKPSDLRTLRTASDIVGAELTALGYAKDYRYAVPDTGRNFLMGDHPMGATRMSASAETGVVDAECRVHGTRNLFVSSSSVFPSTGWSNPTLTIVAIARRLASWLHAGKATGGA